MTALHALPERIRQRRLERGMSQENMADQLGISTTAYGDLERGRTELTLSRLVQIGKILEVSLSGLLDLQETVSETDWLRGENQRLMEENTELRFRLAQWKEKFQEWLASALLRQGNEERGRIGF